MSTRSNVLVLTVAGLTLAAHADDTAGSDMLEEFDTPTAGGATGDFSTNDSDGLLGINPDTTNPDTTLIIELDFWRFELAHHVDSYLDTDLDGIPDGAGSVMLGVRGRHKVGPHTGDAPTNDLPLIWSNSEWIPWGKPRHIAVSATVPHPGAHEDWYGASTLATAFDQVPATGAPRRIGDTRPGREQTIVAARHPRDGHADQVFDLKLDWNTVGSKPPAVYFDPATGKLHIPPIFIDPFLIPGSILDAEGGRSGGVDPAFADDPMIGAGTGPIDLTCIGRDDATGEYLFAGSPFVMQNPAASLRIEGHIGIFRISSTLPGEFAHAFAPFERLVVIDTADPDESPSTWARQFVRDGWFGEALSEEQRHALVYPVIAITTDVDLVAATDGFTRPAELPATVLLSIGTHTPHVCAPDLNGDHVLNFFDIQQFLAAFAAHEPAADWNQDGVRDFFDVQAFLNDFSAGCL